MDDIITLVTLTLLEIALGIDNVVFVSIVINKLPKEHQQNARRFWLFGGLVMKALMLLGVGYLAHMENALFTIFEHDISIKDLIMIVGGLFLIAKATLEIHSKLNTDVDETTASVSGSITSMFIQILILDSIFSLDFIITAVGFTPVYWIMIAAISISVVVMFVFAKPLAHFIDHNPTSKMLALSFLILIGMTVLIDGFGQHMNKGYVYFAMLFSVGVEAINIAISKKKTIPVKLNFQTLDEDAEHKADFEPVKKNKKKKK